MMSIRIWSACGLIALSLALAIPACDDSSNTPQSPDVTATVTGTVVADQTGAPIANMTVDLERCRCAEMMGSSDWAWCDSMMTNADGQFHFEYRRESMQHYRVHVRGQTHSHCMSYVDSRDEQGIVLRVP